MREQPINLDRGMVMKLMSWISAGVAALTLATGVQAGSLADGSKEHPLRVLMVPTDTGTNDITMDYAPVFNGITENYGIHFDLKAGARFALYSLSIGHLGPHLLLFSWWTIFRFLPLGSLFRLFHQPPH